MPLTEITDDQFAEATATGLVLIDFYAPWCGPCQMQGPVLEQMAADHGDDLRIYKMNVDHSPETPQRFGVSTIPNLVLLRDGEPVEQFHGMQNRQTLENAVAAATGSP